MGGGQHYAITTQTYYDSETSNPFPIENGDLPGSLEEKYFGSSRYYGIKIKNDFSSDSIKFKENGSSSFTTLDAEMKQIY